MRSIADLMDLRNRVALVTGGAGHIGSSAVETLAELGASIVVLDVDAAACEVVADRARLVHGVSSLGLSIDLCDAAAVLSVPDRVRDEFGRLDMLVNCAAIVGTDMLEGWNVEFERQSLDAWRKAIETNLTAVFALVQACHNLLADSGHGSIVNVASINEKIEYTNFLLLDSYSKSGRKMIDRDHKDLSLLLEYGLPADLAKSPHPGERIQPAYQSRSDRNYRRVLDWVRSLKGPPHPDYRVRPRVPWATGGGGSSLPDMGDLEAEATTQPAGEVVDR